jgi:hypothetical protein
MSDKAPIAEDHGAALFGHARGKSPQPEGKRGGISPHARGVSREHEKQPLPSLPWAVSERVAPKKADTQGFNPATIANSNPNHRPVPATAAPGRGELGNPDVHLAPKRRVAGKHGLPVHDTERPAELRRAKLHGPHALSNKLKSELPAPGKHRAHEGVHGGNRRSPGLGGADRPDAAHRRIGSPTDAAGIDGIGYSA